MATRRVPVQRFIAAAGGAVQPPPNALHRPTSDCRRASFAWTPRSRGRVQRLLRFQEREKISGAGFIAQLCAAERALALRDIVQLELHRPV